VDGQWSLVCRGIAERIQPAVRFAICNETFEGWNFAEVCRVVAEAGYDGIELAPFTFAPSVEDLGPAEREAIRREARTHGLEIVGLHWLLVSPAGLHISSPDDAVRRSTVGYLDALIQFCADLGGRVLVFGSPQQRIVLPGMTHAEARQRALETFAACGRAAERSGVLFCLEPLSPSETNFMTSARDAISMIEALQMPSVRLLLDVKAMSSEGRSIPVVIRESAPYLAHFHCNDANRRGPGFGETDFVPIFQALKEAGYRGYGSVEVFDYRPDPQTIATASLAYLRRVAAAVAL
jgi:sugar phosphate isomerase/epimerase